MIGPIKTVGIYVSDPEASLAFYVERLGFELRRRLPMGPHATWIEVAPPGAQSCLVLYPRSMMTDADRRLPSLVFHCADVEATCRELKARGVTITTPPRPLPWGTWAAIADPDGNELALTSQELAPGPSAS